MTNFAAQNLPDIPAASPMDKINIYSMMAATVGSCNTMLSSIIPDMEDRSRELGMLIEHAALIQSRMFRLLEPLAFDIMREVTERTEVALMPSIYHRKGDSTPFRVKDGETSPLCPFEIDEAWTYDRSRVEEEYKMGATVLVDRDDRGRDSFIELYKPGMPEQVLLDWRRAPNSNITFSTCCIFKEKERWFTLEVPGEGDSHEKSLIAGLLDDYEREIYDECCTASELLKRSHGKPGDDY